jgi:DNA-binding CsgD family transcriptional regulator
VLTFLACFLVCRTINPLGRFTWLVLLSSLMTALGTAAITVSEYLAAYEQVCLVSGGVLTGVGSAVITLLWGENLGISKTRQTLMCCIFATIVGAIFCILLDVLIPAPILRCAIVPFPFLGALLLLRSSQGVRTVSHSRYNKKPPVFLPLRIAVISGFFGFSFGLMYRLAMPLPFTNQLAGEFLSLGALAFAGILVFISTMVLKFDFRRLTYQISLPLMALGFILITVPSMELLGSVVHNVGYEYFNIILWSLWAFFGTRDDIAPAWVFACGFVFMQLGQLAGSGLGELLGVELLGLTPLATISLFVLFGILMMAIFFLGSRDFQLGFSLIKPGVDAPLGERKLRREVMLCCTSIGNTNDLTSREIEVMTMLAHGYNRPQIRAELFISDETVKTHIKHIYKKLDIHSRDDLADLVEKELAYCYI